MDLHGFSSRRSRRPVHQCHGIDKPRPSCPEDIRFARASTGSELAELPLEGAAHGFGELVINGSAVTLHGFLAILASFSRLCLVINSSQSQVNVALEAVDFEHSLDGAGTCRGLVLDDVE